MSTTRQASPHLKRAFVAAMLGVLTLPGAGRLGAQTPAPVKEPDSLEELMRHPLAGPPTDKIAPNMNGIASYTAHEEALKKMYSPELMDPLSDRFDRTVPGGFKAALAHAREAGIPDALLAEIESTQAMFEVNYPALVATMPRLRTAWQHWDEKASIFPNRKEFEIYLRMVFETVERERTTPGSFAQTAMRLRKRAIARAVYNDLRQVDSCADQSAILHNTRFGDAVPVEAWLQYARPGTHLAINKGTDVTGQPFGPQRAGTMPAVPAATYKAVADAVPDSFWKPYRIPAATTANP